MRKSLRRLVRPVYIPLLAVSLSRGLTQAVFPQYLAGLGAGLAVVGTVLAMRGFGRMASDLPGGIILARLGIRPVTVFCFVMAIAANLALVFVRSIEAISLLVFTAGFFGSISTTSFMTIVRLSVPAETRGRALSLAGGPLRIGRLVGPVAGGVLADHLGMPIVFAVRSSVLLLGLLSFISGSNSVPENSAARNRSLVKMVQAVKDGLKGRWYALGTVGSAVLILMWLRTSRSIILPLWGAHLGLSATVIGSIISIGAAVELLIFIPAGIIMDRFGRKAAGGLCIGLFSLGLFLLPAGTGIHGFILAAIILGIGNGFGAGINMIFGTDLAPSGAVSEFLGLWRLYGDLGGATGPLIIGVIASIFTLPASILAAGGFGILGVLILTIIAPETLHIARSR